MSTTPNVVEYIIRLKGEADSARAVGQAIKAMVKEALSFGNAGAGNRSLSNLRQLASEYRRTGEAVRRLASEIKEVGTASSRMLRDVRRGAEAIRRTKTAYQDQATATRSYASALRSAATQARNLASAEERRQSGNGKGGASGEGGVTSAEERRQSGTRKAPRKGSPSGEGGVTSAEERRQSGTREAPRKGGLFGKEFFHDLAKNIINWGTAGIGTATKKGVINGADYQRSIVGLKAANIPQPEIENAKKQAWQLQAKYPNVEASRILDAYKMLWSKDANKAPELLPAAIRMQSALNAVHPLGNDTENLQLAIQEANTLGNTQSPERFEGSLDSFMKAKVPNGENGLNSIEIYKDDPVASFNSMTTAFGNFGAALSSPIMKDAAAIMSGIASGLGSLAQALGEFQNAHPDIAKFLAGGVIAGGAAAGVYGSWGLFKGFGEGFGLKSSAVALDSSAAALTRAAVALGGKGVTPLGPNLPDPKKKNNGLLFGVGPVFSAIGAAYVIGQQTDEAMAEIGEKYYAARKELYAKYGEDVINAAWRQEKTRFERDTPGIRMNEKIVRRYLDEERKKRRGWEWPLEYDIIPGADTPELREILRKNEAERQALLAKQEAEAEASFKKSAPAPVGADGKPLNDAVLNAQQTGNAINNALSVNVKPTVDTSPFERMLDIVNRIVEGLGVINGQSFGTLTRMQPAIAGMPGGAEGQPFPATGGTRNVHADTGLGTP